MYIFGFLAWYLSSLILRRECQRNITQSLWIHRFFWIFAGTFSIAKMFEDYFLPLNLILNCFFITSNENINSGNFILAVYGIYRPEDNETLEMIYSEDIPSFAKVFFQTLEVRIK